MYIGTVYLDIGDLIVEERQENESFGLLCDSLKEIGQFNPIIALSNMDGTYRVLAGNRRVHAMAAIGQRMVQAILYLDLSEEEIKNMTTWTCCFHHQPRLTDQQIMDACKLLIEAGYTESDLIKKVGLKKSLAAKMFKK